MSGGVLERARVIFEVSELKEQGIVTELSVKPNGQKAKIWQQHKICSLMDSIANDNKDLLFLLEDSAGGVRADAAHMKGAGMFDSFYGAVSSTKEYYARFPHLEYTSNENKSSEVDISVSFSGEEVFGKYLDLHSFHLQYSNLRHVPAQEQDYLQYLDKFNSFFHIPDNCKTTKQYRSYVSELWSYLSDFFSRVQPLVDKNELISSWRAEFEKKWSSGDISGRKKMPSNYPQPLRLGMFNSAEELEALGLERLKQALEALGLKCGGTLKDRAARLFSVRGKKAEDIPQKLKVTKGVGAAENEDSNATQGTLGDSRHETAWFEFCIQNLCDLIADVVVATRKHAEKQQSRTVEEKEAEILEEEYGHVVDDGPADVDADRNDDEPFYNPLNLPLGWDGKPIPFWLYKLHGLGVEYKCEVCGNQSYWGRRAFDKHFQEWRHAHGMRCLGVPNTKHFHDITLIEDVLALYNKIKGTIKVEQIANVEEEFEDTEGNVLNRRTYEDLARQGLL